MAARLNAQPGGFYHPSVVVGDARRHGLAVLGPDLALSAYDCTVERDGDRPLAVRLGLRYVRGIAATTGTALVAERDRGGPFRDLADLCRRTHAFSLPEAVTALIAAGACDGWGAPRRHLLWQLPAAWRAATGLPLAVPSPALPAATPAARGAAEAWATGLPLAAHLVAPARAALARAGAVPCAALAGLPAGATATVAGLAAVVQQPPTAHGVAFATIEDEGQLGNLVFAHEVYEQCRAGLTARPIVLATGRVRRRGPVVDLAVSDARPWGARGNSSRRPARATR